MFAVVALGIAIVPLIFGLLLGIALGAPGQPAASYAAAPPAVSSASPAPAPSASAQESPSETHVDEIVRELQALKTLSRWQIAVIGFAAVVIAVLIALLLLRYARIADKMKFGFGFLEFEVKDAVREATERAEDAEALVQKSARTLNTIYTMVHTLQMVGSSDEPVTFNAFLKQCAEEAAAHVDVRISGTVRASVWLADDAQAELRIVAGSAALVALTAVAVLALGTIMRKSAGAVTGGIVILVLPYVIGSAISATSLWDRPSSRTNA